MGWRLSAGVWATVAGAAAGTSLLLVARPADPERQAPIDGFAPAHVAAQHEVEQLDRAVSIRATSRSRSPSSYGRTAYRGSPRDRLLAEWTRDRWIAAGLDSVEIVEHDVLLPYPLDASIEMVDRIRGTRRFASTPRNRSPSTRMAQAEM